MCPRLTAGLALIISELGELWRGEEHRTESNKAKGLGVENRIESRVSLRHSHGIHFCSKDVCGDGGYRDGAAHVSGEGKEQKVLVHLGKHLGALGCLFVSAWWEQNPQLS